MYQKPESLTVKNIFFTGHKTVFSNARGPVETGLWLIVCDCVIYLCQ